MVRGLAHFAAAEGWGQLAFFGFIGFLLFAAPSIEAISRPTLVSAVLVVLYLMTPSGHHLDVGAGPRASTGLSGAGPGTDSHARAQRADAADGQTQEARRFALRDSIRLDSVTFSYRDRDDDEGFPLGPVDLTLRPRRTGHPGGGQWQWQDDVGQTGRRPLPS